MTPPAPTVDELPPQLRLSDAMHAFSSMQDTRPYRILTNCARLAIDRKPFEGVLPVSEAVAQAPQVQAAAQEMQPQVGV